MQNRIVEPEGSSLRTSARDLYKDVKGYFDSHPAIRCMAEEVASGITETATLAVTMTKVPSNPVVLGLLGGAVAVRSLMVPIRIGARCTTKTTQASFHDQDSEVDSYFRAPTGARDFHLSDLSFNDKPFNDRPSFGGLEEFERDTRDSIDRLRRLVDDTRNDRGGMRESGAGGGNSKTDGGNDFTGKGSAGLA